MIPLAACDNDDPNMKRTGHIRPLQEDSFFADGNSSRPLVPGTVARDQPPTSETINRQEFGRIDKLPMPLTADLLRRGQQRYEIYCTPCHGATGYGDGMIVQRGFTPPPSLHSDRLRQIPVGHYVDVITNGWGAMYSYSNRVSLPDRWAIAAYIRALQLSQHAPSAQPAQPAPAPPRPKPVATQPVSTQPATPRPAP